MRGDSPQEIANGVRVSFNEISQGRARTIAVSETGAAFSWGNFTAQKEAGITRRQWTTSRLANVRPAHQEAEGQIVSIDDDFYVGGEYLKYPTDELGRPDNTIQCHCISVALPPETTTGEI
jgi:uncharacterized protein with gpF-like domain